MRVITSGKEAEAAEDQLIASVRSRGSETEVVSIGYQSGHFDAKVIWAHEFGFWGYFGFPPSEKSPGERYWNVFGLGAPLGSVSIACEINTPVSGTNRQAAGVFLSDSSGQTHMGHRGIFNANGRVQKDFVFSNFRGEKLEVDDAGRRSNVLYIGRLNDPQFPAELRHFIDEAVRVKDLVRRKSTG